MKLELLGNNKRPTMQARRLAIALPLLYGLLVPFVSLIRIIPRLIKRPPLDPVTLNEDRLAPVRPFLAPGQTVGYIFVTRGSNERISQPYFLAQYALSPAVLIRAATPERILVDTPPGTQPPRPDPGFRKTAEFPGGLVLFERIKR